MKNREKENFLPRFPNYTFDFVNNIFAILFEFHENE